jgi:hypothetical protein
MTAPQGHWRIVANGFQSDLNLTADLQENIHGTVKIDAPNVEQIHGFWDETEQRLVFQRPVQNADGKPRTTRVSCSKPPARCSRMVPSARRPTRRSTCSSAASIATTWAEAAPGPCSAGLRGRTSDPGAKLTAAGARDRGSATFHRLAHRHQQPADVTT